MRNIITLLMALLLACSNGATAYASVGEPFGVGYRNPTELAQAMRANLARDARGITSVSSKCLPNQYSCASVSDYLIGFQKADPDAGLTSVTQVPAYLETLVKDTPPDEFWMACLKKGSGALIWNCLSRKLKPQEFAWKNPVTGRTVLAGDCTNPMGEPVNPPDCVEIEYYLKEGDEVHIGLLGPDRLPASTCTAILKAGETEWSNLLLDECPRRGCDYRGPAKELSMSVQRDIRVSYVGKEGVHRLRLPAFMLQSADLVAFCVVKSDRTQSRASLIGRQHYWSKRTAFLSYQEVRMPMVPTKAFVSHYEWAHELAPAR